MESGKIGKKFISQKFLFSRQIGFFFKVGPGGGENGEKFEVVEQRHNLTKPRTNKNKTLERAEKDNMGENCAQLETRDVFIRFTFKNLQIWRYAVPMVAGFSRF